MVFFFFFPQIIKNLKKNTHNLVLLLEIVMCTYWLLTIETFTWLFLIVSHFPPMFLSIFPEEGKSHGCYRPTTRVCSFWTPLAKNWAGKQEDSGSHRPVSLSLLAPSVCLKLNLSYLTTEGTEVGRLYYSWESGAGPTQGNHPLWYVCSVLYTHLSPTLSEWSGIEWLCIRKWYKLGPQDNTGGLKVPATKPELDAQLEGQKWLWQAVLSPPHLLCGTLEPLHMYAQNK